jgi:O-antigen ligase
MNKLNTCLFLLIFILSLFALPSSFVTQTTPAFYLSTIGCILLAIVSIVGKYEKQTLQLSLSEILFVGFLLFVTGYGEYTGQLGPEWVISGLSLLIFYQLSRKIVWKTIWVFSGIVFLGVAEAFFGLGQYLHWFNHPVGNFPMTGTLDNPAGFAVVLSAVLPFALFLVSKKEIFWRVFGGLAAVLFIVTVALSHSRAGIIAITVISGLWFGMAFNLRWLKQWGRGVRVLAGSIIMVIILSGLYLLKKDSADGRLLIWKCTAKMIADKPLLGHGAGGFQREYMLYQADYFKNHPESSYAMLADIVKHPF